MIYLAIAILCSVIVSINLKLLRRYYTNAYQAIVFNYPTAALLCFLFFKPDLSTIPTIPDFTLYCITSVLLLSIFYFISKSIATSGIIITVIAQRLSLALPIIASFLLFNEQLTPIKIIGLTIGFMAIVASKPDGKFSLKDLKFWFPIIVFLGTGIIDILFNFLTKIEGISFTSSLFYVFSIATILAFGSLAYQKINGTLKFQTRAALAGIVLGFFNFGSIYFYIFALQIEKNRPSVVYAALDIGVITLGSLAGLILFKERLNVLNKIGLFLAIVSIIILTFS
ncbi:EamA/RhaT family transporter [Pedobacter glucosidilyticus]|uniref:EamA/RhaT family transporter n=1 Tax=Pedobacter glucosidilyticus TaxID=1122941 RepID=UPI0026EE6282|nr:EamA/RhaT family transporter [Pedobacter glucosidilyticus]